MFLYFLDHQKSICTNISKIGTGFFIIVLKRQLKKKISLMYTVFTENVNTYTGIQCQCFVFLHQIMKSLRLELRED